MRRLPRRLGGLFVVRVLGVVALGFATAVAVAWALALWAPHEAKRWRFNLVDTGSPGKGEFIAVHELRRPGLLRRSWTDRGVFSTPDWYEDMKGDALVVPAKWPREDRRWGRLGDALDSGGARNGMEDARGWPWLALWCALEPAAIEGKAAAAPVWGGIGLTPRPTRTAEYRALPFMPIWTGLAANTAVFSAVWLLLFAGVRGGRRMLRGRRGACLGCGYDLRASEGGSCPECGGRRSGRGKNRRAPT